MPSPIQLNIVIINVKDGDIMSNPTMSLDTMKMLSEIFRVIIKEIKTDEDVTNLAPGELGIDYSLGTLLVKDPYTGKVTSPNTIKYAEEIVSRYDPETKQFNADLLDGVKLYKDFSEFDGSPINHRLTLIIPRMVSPSVLVCKVDSAVYDYTTLKYPAKNGILHVIKLSDAFVVTSFHDTDTNSDYVGRYDPGTHQFKGWNNYGLDMSRFANIVVDRKDGTTNYAHVIYNKPLTKYALFNIGFTAALTGTLRLTVNNMEELVVMGKDLLPYAFDVAPNAKVLLLYNYVDKCFIVFEQSSESPLQTILDIIIYGGASTDKVTSVNGETGAVILNAAKINLTEASIFDPNKSIELAIIDLHKTKAPIIHKHSSTDITEFGGFKLLPNTSGGYDIWLV